MLQRQLAGAIPGGGGGLEGVRDAPAGARQRLAEPLAAAFTNTYWWALALTAVAFVPATVLALTERRERRERGPQRAPQAAPIAG